VIEQGTEGKVIKAAIFDMLIKNYGDISIEHIKKIGNEKF